MKTKKTIVMAGLLGLGVLLTGCGLEGAKERDTVSYDVAEKVAAVKIEGDSGAIVVTESDRKGIHVTETLTWRKSKPEPTHKVQGDTLVLEFTCPVTVGLGSCDVAYEVEVPRGLRIEAGSDSGEVTLRALSGEVEAKSDSGRIEARDLTAKRVRAESDSGDMTLVFAQQPDKVTTSTDSGRTEVRVPEGPYKITTSTDSGDEKVGAKNDASASRVIDMSSGSGDLELATR
ncbi:DUF4097 family beta strand repeat-containing protein [Nonomuraea sp. NPDC059194]|uniref:DUF4097 family beta strand repeat-containing protein n=1 Tax=Nonomuraea sp. NPDC059194 TaxID=3346764 RepID=UPI0036A7E454